MANDRFHLTRTKQGAYSYVMPPGDAREDLRHAVQAFGHLVQPDCRVDGPAFAHLIRHHYTHPKAVELAAILERS